MARGSDARPRQRPRRLAKSSSSRRRSSSIWPLELEKELVDEEELEGEELLVAPEEQSLEEIVEGFKKGMAETLSAEDYDTHYNLGIAYQGDGAHR